MTQRNDKHSLRSLVYVSELKLNQILDSVGDRPRWPTATELKINLKLLSLTFSNTPQDRSLRNRNRIARLTVAEQFLRDRVEVEDVASGHGWIAGQADMGWELLPDYKTVLFCGYVPRGHAGPVLLALGGSASNVLGSPSSQEQTGSLMPTIREAVSSSDQPEQFWSDLRAAACGVSVVPQPVRFLARVLARHVPDGDDQEGAPGDDRARCPIVVATPLYVEYADDARNVWAPGGPGAGQPDRASGTTAVSPMTKRPPSRESLPRLGQDDPRTIGPYTVIHRLGQGSMGIVYLVKDNNGNRRALKTIRPEYVQDPEFRRRFGIEISTSQQVQAPFVTQVVDAAAETEIPYLVTEVIEGPTLLEKVSGDGRPLPFGKTISLATGTASALAAIHRAGIIHRDLTPSNVIVSHPEPKVIDFGLASPAAAGRNAVGQDARLDGFRVGTPAYISPEQIQGKEVTSASDIFSWAGTMVYAATGYPPFESTSRMDTFREILEEEPDLTSVPSQLRGILSAALSKTPADRPSAETILRDLATIPRSGMPSATRPGRRRRIALRASAALVLLAAATAVSGFLTAGNGDRPAHRRDPQSGMTATGALTAVLRNPKYAPFRATFSPDGKSLAVGSLSLKRPDGGATYLWNVATGKLRATFTDTDSGGVGSVAYAPGGRTLATGDANGGVFVWNTATGKLAATLTDPSTRGWGAGAAAYAPGGQTLATGYGDGNIYLWNTATDTYAATLTDPGSQDVQSAAYAPGGRTLATGDGNGHIYLWNTATGKPIATLADPGGKDVQSVAYAPDGQTLAIGDWSGHIYLWNTATDTLTATLTDPRSDGVYSALYAPDGRTLATADEDGNVYLWNTATDTLTATFTDPHTEGVSSIAYAPDGQTIAADDWNGNTYLWRITIKGPVDRPRA